MEKKNRIWILVGFIVILLGLTAIGIEYSWQLNDPRNIFFPGIMSISGSLTVLLGTVIVEPIKQLRN